MNLAHTLELHFLTFYLRDTNVTGGKIGATVLRRYVRLLDLPTALTLLIIKKAKKVYFATK